LILRLANTVVYETKKVGHLLKDENFLGINCPEKYINIFNGVSKNRISKILATSHRDVPREKIIIFSGRLSSPQKNVELIFKSDPVPHGWKIRFLGTVDDAFRSVVDYYRQRDSQFNEKYEFFGEVTNKADYYRELMTGKILLLCSNWEGFPMVYSEAHYFGLYIVTTDVSGAAEATDDGRLGTVIPAGDAVALRQALHDACTQIDIDKAVDSAREYGQSHFVWEDSLRAIPLEQELEDV